jgi:hypothetical protein
MPGKRHTIIQWFSLLAGALIALQIVLIVARGEAFCFNEGCRVVEKLTIIPPLYINLAGLLYFIILFIVSRRSRGLGQNGLDLTAWLLLLGLAAESVQLSYQLFAIRTFCSYCLGIFSIIVVLNLLYGWRQIRVGIPVFGAVIAAFAAFNFSPASLLALRSETFASGTYAIRKCAVPAKQLYLFFSSDCPHCQKVLSVLENCNSCEFHFNPIDQPRPLVFPELEYTPSYSPALNRVILSMLDITTIPVLLVKNQDGLTFIKGEGNIIRFVSQACFLPEQGLSTAPPLYDDQQEMNGKEEECVIEEECPEISAEQQSSQVQ